MAYSVDLLAFFGLMTAQSLGAAFAYLYPWHQVHRAPSRFSDL